VRFVLILADPEEQSSHIAMCDVRAATHAVGARDQRFYMLRKVH
jgi:hypothetical protein